MVTNWATSISHYKNRGFKRFAGVQLSFCVFLWCPIICQFSKNSLFSKKGCNKLGFSIFCVLTFASSLFLGLLKPYENRGFSTFSFFVVEREEKRQKK